MASTQIYFKMVPAINVCIRSESFLNLHICMCCDSGDIIRHAVNVKPRYGHTAAVVGNCVYIFGGDLADDESKDSV